MKKHARSPVAPGTGERLLPPHLSEFKPRNCAHSAALG